MIRQSESSGQQVKGTYDGTPSAAGYTMEDGTALTLSEKDQKWPGLE